MIIRGEGPDRLINLLSKRFDTSKSAAANLVQTESAFLASNCRKEAMESLDVEEFEIVETLDLKTCDTCGGLDGTHLPMDKFEPWVTAPPFHHRCRGTTVPYFEDYKNGERAARGADGKTYYVPESMTYKEWFKEHVESNPQFLAEKKKWDNRFSDKKQYERYTNVLGKKQVGSFADFQNLKYNNIEGWNRLKVAYKDQPIRNKIQSELQPKTIEPGKQGKHILGHNNYIEGRSYLTISIEEAQELVNKYAGTGELFRDKSGKWRNQEVILSDKVIGVDIDNLTGEERFTKAFKIHYSNKGTHIVPKKEG